MSNAPFELSVTRFIAAPPAKVWNVLANRQEEWWCPKPWTVKLEEQDRRPGGAANMTMYGPDGEVAPQRGIYLAYDEGKRIVTTDAVTVDGDFLPAGPMMIGFWEIVLAQENGVEGTRYTGRARHWTEESMKSHEAMGFVEGWGICADQLAELCEKE
jgi:uncharacterized protein YndB with AHSA1/START domain